MTVRLVCLSDTHGHHDELAVPDGDVLVHAGDLSRIGRPREIASFGAFLARMPHAHKVVVAGNHDFLFEHEPERALELLGPVTYLRDAGAKVAGLSFWGSPWQPRFHDWAFNLDRGEALAERWALVPDGVDGLVTHSPPYGLGDRTASGLRVGCEELALALERIRPRVHVFGHIHEDHGIVAHPDGRVSANACTCDLRYRANNPPVVLDVDEREVRVVAQRS
jgi:3',5'-cyclic AMP phosphodiesterase CpdA